MINLANIKEANEKFDNRYQLISKIGGGGFSEVWLAYDINAGIEVALKIYTPSDDLDEDGKEDFRREFARLCSLNHSNIIHAIGFGIHDDKLPYLAMNVCKNGSAKRLVGHFKEEELWRFIEQVASGLQYLHAHDITHQDIKPDNILINSDGQYLIIDFGISTKTRNTLRKSSKSSTVGGTTWYMSVESFGTDSPDIHARDIWAFGATLFEIITGDVPFGQYGGISQKSAKGKIPQINNDVSDELKQLVYDCLALNAWDRPDAGKIIECVKLHNDGGQRKKHKLNKLFISAAVVAFIAVCIFIGYGFVEKNISSDVVTELNKNDSIFLAQVNEAIAISSFEVKKKDLALVDEMALCSAAKLYKQANELVVTDSIKQHAIENWTPSQLFIDSIYVFLYNKGVEYGEMEAYSASSDFEKRSMMLADYVTPSKRKTDMQSKNKSKTSISPQVRKTHSKKAKEHIIENERASSDKQEQYSVEEIIIPPKHMYSLEKEYKPSE